MTFILGAADAQFQGLRLAITYIHLWACIKKRQGMAALIAAKFDTQKLWKTDFGVGGRK